MDRLNQLNAPSLGQFGGSTTAEFSAAASLARRDEIEMYGVKSVLKIHFF
jgi:hypothetical protein